MTHGLTLGLKGLTDAIMFYELRCCVEMKGLLILWFLPLNVRIALFELRSDPGVFVLKVCFLYRCKVRNCVRFRNRSVT